MRQEEMDGQIEVYDSCKVKKRKAGKKVVLLILFFIFGLPLAGTLLSAGASAVVAVIAAVIGIFGGLIGLIIGGGILVAGLFAAGIGLIISGCMNMAQVSVGLMVIGGGFLMLSAAMLLAVGVGWCEKTVVAGLFRSCIEIVRGCIRWVSSIVQRLFDRGGEKR